MNICIVGAGAIGGMLGARLALAGESPQRQRALAVLDRIGRQFTRQTYAASRSPGVRVRRRLLGEKSLPTTGMSQSDSARMIATAIGNSSCVAP